MRNAQVLRLPTSASSDLQWWSSTLNSWPGKSFFLLEEWTPAPDLQFQIEAGGALGYGAYLSGRWLRGNWSAEQLERHITYKELYAILVACATWASRWTRMRTEVQCDNQAVVECLKTGTCRCPHVMTLIRALYSVCVKHNFLIRTDHMLGVTNSILAKTCLWCTLITNTNI